MNATFKSLLRSLLVFSGLIQLLWLAPAWFSREVLDRALTSQSQEMLLIWLLGAVGAISLAGALEYLRGRLQDSLGHIVNDMLMPLVTELTLAQGARLRGPLSTSGLRDVARLRTALASDGFTALLDLPWTLLSLGLIWVLHDWLGLLAATCAALLLLLAFIGDLSTREPLRELHARNGRAQRMLELAMQNAEVAHGLGMAAALIGRWSMHGAGVANVHETASVRSIALQTLVRVLRQVAQLLAITLGAYLAWRQQVSIGTLVAAMLLTGRALRPLEQLSANWRVLSEGRLAYARIKPLVGELKSLPSHLELITPKGRLVAQGLSYRVPQTERLLLNGISVHLEPGESLAILGASGAGKSTLLRLLLGLWKPSTGTVHLDEADITHWERGQLGQHIGYLPQDIELFTGTVSENIARMDQPDPLKVIDAAKLARVHDLIMSFPDGYDTLIDPHSSLLAPGVRQRIALARALYRQPSLVLLDEPNSNLDGAGDLGLAAALKDLHGQSTVVLVTHRTALLQYVDKIMVLEGGRMTRCGPAAEVLQALQGGATRPAAKPPVPPVSTPAPVVAPIPVVSIVPITPAAAPAVPGTIDPARNAQPQTPGQIHAQRA